MANAVSGIVLVLALGLGGITLFPATGDVFCDNLKQVAATLPNNTASSPVHFATTVFGQAPDAVYALAFCRGDVVSDTTCGECVANTSDTINPTLSSQQQSQCYQDAYYYGSGCTLAYAAGNILTSSNTTAGNNGDDMPLTRWGQKNWGNWSTHDITGDGDDIALTVGLLNELLVKTVQTAASTTPGRFTTGVMDSPTFVFYSMAQCTPDLSDSKCLACLTGLLGRLNFTMTLRTGAQLHVIRCFFRYELYRFYDSEPILHLRRSSAPTPVTAPVKHNRRKNNFWIILIAVLPPAAAAILCFIFCSPWLRSYRKVERLQAVSRRTGDLKGEEELVWQGNSSSEFCMFEFEQLLEATNNFSEENKLGQGGFGAVYKGQFPQGLEIAVKRLSSHSGQGFIEFKNEVQLIAKLQHRNLVRLLGCCSQEEEKVLVYEYLPNKILDFFIFDENRRALLDWNNRIAIIEGIAHGLLYLHRHSRLRVIHRDLKPSNILLDGEMTPKISDFGLAKIFTSNNIEESTTRRVVGTYGYMAPEYAYQGLFSIKSDVFSFGVLVLEILGGKRNSANSHECGNFINLLGYAWKLFEEERWSELIDASLDTIGHSEEMMRCLNIALLCVQEKAADRPTMSDVVAMLSNKSMVLVKPKHPAYFNLSSLGKEASTATRPGSINGVTISVTTIGR